MTTQGDGHTAGRIADPALIKRIARVIADAEGAHIGEAPDFGEWHAEEFEGHAVAVLRALASTEPTKAWDAATVNECACIVEYIAEHAASDGDTAYLSDKALSVAAYNLRDLLKMAAQAMRAELAVTSPPATAMPAFEERGPFTVSDVNSGHVLDAEDDIIATCELDEHAALIVRAVNAMPAFEAMKGVLRKARRYVQDAEARYAITKGFDTQSVIATSVLAEIDAALAASGGG